MEAKDGGGIPKWRWINKGKSDGGTRKKERKIRA